MWHYKRFLQGEREEKAKIEKNWYLQTWFNCDYVRMLVSLWSSIDCWTCIAFYSNEAIKKLNDSYGSYDELQRKISSLSSDYKIKSDELEDT